MPWERSRYPDDWEAISRRIRFERAGGKCEWCGVPNGAYITRNKREPRRVTVYRDELAAEVAAMEGERVVRVVLTVAHLGVARPDGSPGDKHDKSDVRDENLAALCQACHLNYDRDDHLRNAAETRRRKRHEAGQLALEMSRTIQQTGAAE